jgi:hypothetical protein
VEDPPSLRPTHQLPAFIPPMLGNYPPFLKKHGLYFSQAIVWDKQHPVLTRKDYMGAFELSFTVGKRAPRTNSSGRRTREICGP